MNQTPIESQTKRQTYYALVIENMWGCYLYHEHKQKMFKMFNLDIYFTEDNSPEAQSTAWNLCLMLFGFGFTLIIGRGLAGLSIDKLH